MLDLVYFFGYCCFWGTKARQHRRFEAKSSNKNLATLIDSESKVFSSTVIAALQLSADGLELSL